MTRRFIFLLFSLAFLFIIWGQSKDVFEQDPGWPAEISVQLDSLHRADNLNEWLNTCMDYEEPNTANYVKFLAKARSLIWRPCHTDEERLTNFYFLATLGYWQLYSGNIVHSIESYEEAYRFYFAQPIPGANVLEYVLKPLGNNYTRLGDYDRALLIQEKSLKMAEQEDSSQTASICHNLATTARWKGDLPLALHYGNRGMISVKKNSALHGLLLSNLSVILFELKKTDDAADANKEAIKILEQKLTDKDEPNAAYWLSGAYQGRGDIQKEKKEFSAALLSYQKAGSVLDHYYKGQRKREKAKLFVSNGRVWMNLNQNQKALEQFNAALSVLLPAFIFSNAEDLPPAGALYGENTLLDALHGKADCLAAMNKKEAALAFYLLLFVAERKLRHEFFSPASRRQMQKENRQWAESALETAYGLWTGTGKKEYAEQALLIAEMSKAQLLLDELTANLHYSQSAQPDSLLDKLKQLRQAIAYFEREIMQHPEAGKKDSHSENTRKELLYELSLIEKRVKEKYPALRGYLQEEQMPDPEKILNDIPGEARVIEFFTGEKNIYVFEAVKGKVMFIHLIENAGQVKKEIQDFVTGYFQQGPAKMMNEPESYYKEAYRIYQLLWPGNDTTKKGTWIIIPDGVLGYLPFDALVTNPVYKNNIEQWPFLAGRCNLYFNYSLQTLQQQQKTGHPQKKFSGFFISFDSSRMASLPAVKKEFNVIKKTVHGNFFTGDAARLETFRASLGQVNLLHISTHSFLQGEEQVPVLQLADDKFFLFELYGNAFQPQLVVLSACRTGHGLLAEGEGIISLARGFTATGTGGILAGLWDMNDESTAELMGKFYQRLARDKRPADAIHAAKLEWISRHHEQSFKKLPYFWAGLIYAGDNRPVELATRKPAPSLIVWIAAGLLLLLTILLLKKAQRKTKRNKNGPFEIQNDQDKEQLQINW